MFVGLSKLVGFFTIFVLYNWYFFAFKYLDLIIVSLYALRFYLQRELVKY